MGIVKDVIFNQVVDLVMVYVKGFNMVVEMVENGCYSIVVFVGEVFMLVFIRIGY